MFRLRIIHGKHVGRTTLLSGELVLGRSDDADLPLFDQRSSRRHARILLENGIPILEDLQSANGTRVNDRKIERAELRIGDLIAIGDTELRLESDEVFERSTEIGSDGFDFCVESRLSDAEVAPAGARDAARWLEAVVRLGNELAAARSVQEAADKTILALRESFGADRAALFLVDGRGELTFLAGDRQPPVSRTLLDAVKQTREAVLASAPQSPTDTGPKSLAAQNVRSAVCAPILFAGEWIGALYCSSGPAGRRLGDEDLKILIVVARLLSPVLFHSRRHAEAADSVRRLQSLLDDDVRIVGSSPAVARLLSEAARAAQAESTVLILGETGVGKELVARAIHASGPRKAGPFVALNCAALGGDLLASELFGHEKGAFTGAIRQKRGLFEEANGGILFLDEVGDMPLDVQARMLRAIETRSFYRVGGTEAISANVQILAATNADLAVAVKAKAFREDLFYRLSVLSLEVPPLRRRPEDVPALVDCFLDRLARKFGRGRLDVSAEALALLTGYRWPGNVRQLQNVLERAVVLCSGDTILPEHLKLPSQSAAGESRDSDLLPLKEIERRHIEQVLKSVHWKRGEAARILEISMPTLRKKIEDYEIRPDDREA